MNLEDEECSGWALEVDSDQLRGSPKLILLQLTKRSCQRTQCQPFCHSAFEANWKGSKWAPHELTINLKKCHFEMSSLILCNNNEKFPNQIMMCNVKWTLYNNQQQRLDREEAPKHVAKSNLHQKMPWSLFGGLLPIWSTTAFWIPVKTLYLRSMLKNQWDALQTTMPAAGICQQNEHNSSPWQRPTTHCTTNASKVEQTGPWNFAFSAIFIWPLANWLPLLNKFLLPQPAGSRRCFPSVHWVPKHRCLCYRNKQTYFLLAKMCWL